MVEWTRVVFRYDHEYPPSLPHEIFFPLVNILTKSLLLNEDLDPELGAYHILKNHQMSGDSAKITEKGAKARNSGMSNEGCFTGKRVIKWDQFLGESNSANVW